MFSELLMLCHYGSRQMSLGLPTSKHVREGWPTRSMGRAIKFLVPVFLASSKNMYDYLCSNSTQGLTAQQQDVRKQSYSFVMVRNCSAPLADVNFKPFIRGHSCLSRNLRAQEIRWYFILNFWKLQGVSWKALQTKTIRHTVIFTLVLLQDNWPACMHALMQYVYSCTVVHKYFLILAKEVYFN